MILGVKKVKKKCISSVASRFNKNKFHIAVKIHNLSIECNLYEEKKITLGLALLTCEISTKSKMLRSEVHECGAKEEFIDFVCVFFRLMVEAEYFSF